MEGGHAKMSQIPCNMTGASSKLLQIQGKEIKKTNLTPPQKSDSSPYICEKETTLSCW